VPFQVSTKDFIQQSTVPVNHMLGQFSHSTVPMNHALGQVSHSTVPMNHALRQFSHSTVPMNHALRQFSHSTVPMNHGLGQLNHSAGQKNHAFNQSSHPCSHFISLKLIFVLSSFYAHITKVVSTTRRTTENLHMFLVSNINAIQLTNFTCSNSVIQK